MKKLFILVAFSLLLPVAFAQGGGITYGGGGVQGDTLFRSGKPWVDIRAYGAVGDGVADDTAAIQAAVNVAKGTPLCGTLYIPSSPSGYNITTSIDLTQGSNTCNGLVVLGESPGTAQINCNLALAFPCLDFTGIHNTWIQNIFINGNASGSQTAAILNARKTGTNRGDFATLVNVTTNGKFTKAAVANVSADNSDYREDSFYNTYASSMYLGCTDVLGVGSAYQTFSGVTGCTQYVVDTSILTPSSSGNPAAVNIATISQTTTTLTLTATTPSVFAGQSFTLLNTLGATATTLTSLVSLNGIVTGATSGAHGLVPGDKVMFAGMTPVGLNSASGVPCTLVTASGTAFTCNGGNGLADLTGSIFGTVTRTWDGDYIAATSSGTAPATITVTLGQSATDAGSVAGTVQLSAEAIREDSVAALSVIDGVCSLTGNATACVRSSGTRGPALYIRGMRQENNNSVKFAHVVDVYGTGFINSEISGLFNASSSLFKVGVGQTINNSRLNVRPAAADKTELLFDGGGNVSQVDVIDGIGTGYNFNIGPGSAANRWVTNVLKGSQFAGGGSIMQIGGKVYLSGNSSCVSKYETDTCATSGYLNFPNAKFVYFRNGANNGDIAAMTVDSNNNVKIGEAGSPATVVKRIRADQGTTLVAGDFTIGPTWGNTAATAITNATSKDQASTTTITTGGTGIAANPLYTLTFHDGTWTTIPVCSAVQTGGNDIIATLTVTSRSVTSYQFQWNGTPTTGKTYEISINCMGT